MIQKKPLVEQRVRKIIGSFAWIPHTFLREGFLESLSHHELRLYMFLVLAADRQGISYYSFDRICSLLSITPDDYILSRNSLIARDLISFNGYLFQVLSLPEKPVAYQEEPITSVDEMEERDPASVRQLILRSLGNEG